MIISRTPFRASFAGGGSDVRSFYRREFGAVTATAINKYMYIAVNERFDSSIRVSYSQTEIVDSPGELRHGIVREALQLVGLTRGIEVVSIADIPAGTGLGSSSSFTVGLLNALYAHKGVRKSPEDLAREAAEIEIDRLGAPIGKQDHYLAAYGGALHLRFYPDESVDVEPLSGDGRLGEAIVKDLRLFHLGVSRSANEILTEQQARLERGDTVTVLRQIRDLAIEMRDFVANGGSPSDGFGALLHRGWTLKKQMADGISSPTFDCYYQKALAAGARGGKILGAGGGGFLLLHCPDGTSERVSEALEPLRQVAFAPEPQGSTIVYAG